MRRTGLLFTALAAIAAVMVSLSYKARVGQDYGGTAVQSSAFKSRTSIGGAVCGQMQSMSFVSHSGPLHHGEQVLAVVSVESISKAALTTGEECFILWHSTVDGDFSVEVGGTGTPGTGLLVDSGACTADLTVESRIHEVSLTDNDRSTIYIYVDDGVSTYYAAVMIVDDQTPPDASFTQITVEGSVDDDTITDVYVNSVPVPVVSSQFQAVVSTGLDEIIVEATNGAGQTMRRTVTTW